MDCIEAPPACSSAGHRSLFFGVVVLLVIWVTERLFIALWGEQQPTFFGWLPVRWLFDAAELGVLGTFVFWGIWDANDVLKRWHMQIEQSGAWSIDRYPVVGDALKWALPRFAVYVGVAVAAPVLLFLWAAAYTAP
jgi:hypothetical protein